MAYAAVTGAEVFVDHDLVRGLTSAPVHGLFEREAALRHLLRDTGLIVRQAGPLGFAVIARPPREPTPDRTPSWTADSQQAHFFAVLQTAVRQVLCASPETAPGRYRAVIAMWFDPAGQITRVRLLGSTIEPDAARAIASRIQRVSVGQAPRGLQQPVTLLILPRTSDQTEECATRRAASK